MSEAQDSERLEALTTAVSQSNKYRHISHDLIRQIGQQEMQKRKNLKAAIKATKNKLHQVGGAYQESRINYEQALLLLRDGEIKESCRQIMRLHTSTAERLPMIDRFYDQIFAELPPIRSILDIASGLNPLAIPWMPIDSGCHYTAVDIYADMMDFLTQAFALLEIEGRSYWQNVLTHPPTVKVDVAFILKTLPVLEQVSKTAVSALFDNLNARHLVISFPLQTLGGRKVGMAENYRHQFERWADGRFWHVKELEFPNELVYVVLNEGVGAT